MKKLTLEQALKIPNIKFKVTPKQAQQIYENTPSWTVYLSPVIGIIIRKDLSINPIYGSELKQFNNALIEEIELIEEEKEEFTFKTQQDIWKYLSENEEHKVINLSNDIIGFKNGETFSFSYYRYETWYFDAPQEWKPYTKKEWWETNEGKPLLYWYGNKLDENTGKPKMLGLINVCKGKFYRSDIECKYTVPATLNEIKEYLLKEEL